MDVFLQAMGVSKHCSFVGLEAKKGSKSVTWLSHGRNRRTVKYYEYEVLIASSFSHQVSASLSRAKAAGRTIPLLSRN